MNDMERLAALVLQLTERVAETQRAGIDAAHAMHCLMFALGKSGALDAARFREDFLDTVALHWKEPGSAPQLLRTLLQQLEAGHLQHVRRIE